MNQSQLIPFLAILFFYNVISENDGQSPSRPRRNVPSFVKDNVKRSLPRTFAQSLFEDEFSVKVRRAVLETLFFKKMINNSLSPEEYGGYMVQDAAYIFDAIKAFDIAAENVQGKYSQDFALFFRGCSVGFKSYSTYFTSKWKLQSSKSVIMGPAAATYVAYEMNLAKTSPRHLAIGTLPCVMLWPWLAAQIDDKVSKTNVYRSWVDRILENVPVNAEAFVNKFFSPNDRRVCQDIFNEGIINELNFFRSACGEKLVDYSFGNEE